MRSKAPSPARVAKSGVLSHLVPGQGSDFSGRDFGGEVVHGGNFFESIFNGCTFTGVHAKQSVFQHVEFTEAQFVGCTFQDSSFDHSDFVLANLRDCRFVRCSFQNGEWRDSAFSEVTFEQCIFRNTTTSLIRFDHCLFDDTSAENFIGPSKRFSVFSSTHFSLPPGKVDFLRSNFGLTGYRVPHEPESPADPLFEMSLGYFDATLTSRQFHGLLLTALNQLTVATENPQILRLRYLCGICRSLIDESVLSVFAIQLLDSTVSNRAANLVDRRQVLEMMNLALGLRVALREQIALIGEAVSGLPDTRVATLSLRMDFDNSYDRREITDYLQQMAAYCEISPASIRIEEFRQGSTFVDVLIEAGRHFTEVFRFLKYSLSLATITCSQAGKLKKECDRLTTTTKVAKGQKSAQVRAAPMKGSKINYRPSTAESISKEVVGVRSDGAKSIEVFVDTVNERVLVLGGKVRVTIALR